MVFLISFNFVKPCFHARNHMLFEIVFDLDLASCRIKQLCLIASEVVIDIRGFFISSLVFQNFIATRNPYQGDLVAGMSEVMELILYFFGNNIGFLKFSIHLKVLCESLKITAL